MPKLKYETNNGVIGYTRIGNDAGTIAAYSGEPAGAGDTSLYFYKNKSRRAEGSRVRRLLLAKPDGPVTPSGAQPMQYAELTVSTRVSWLAFVTGDTVPLPKGTYTVYDKADEG